MEGLSYDRAIGQETKPWTIIKRSEVCSHLGLYINLKFGNIDKFPTVYSTYKLLEIGKLYFVVADTTEQILIINRSFQMGKLHVIRYSKGQFDRKILIPAS